MEPSARKLRGVLFLLGDLASSLKQSGCVDSAGAIAATARRVHVVDAREFLEECRVAVEDVLLAERNLPGELIGQMLEALSLLDEVLREGSPA